MVDERSPRRWPLADVARAVVRIRQVRPEFFSDPVIGRMPPDTRLSYIGLWCVADDAGWLEWDLQHIAAMLHPYESVLVRERRMDKAAAALVEAGRVVIHDCGCAFIPRLSDHQKIGGNKSFTTRDKHESRHSRTSTPVGSNGSNGMLGSPARAPEPARGTDDKEAMLTAFRRRGLPVDTVA